MANLCVKKYLMFVWGLLECLLFSGVVFGWEWLVQILKYDGYFSYMCNGTNLTESSMSSYCFDNSTNGIAVFTKIQNVSLSYADANLATKTNAGHKRNIESSVHKPMNNSTPYVKYFGNFTDCAEQEDQFAIMYSSIYFAMNCLTLLAGIFFDKFGTMRTRLVAVLLVTVSTLMMTFSSPGVPWLVIPAMSLVALTGNLILMTNLQVANLHCTRRYTVMATYVGAHDSSAVIVLLMKLSHSGNINVQTSFMFLTISIVPLLVSTIAFLPKIRIPWPLPAHYGKKRGVQVDEVVLRQQQIAWQRKMSAANNKSKLKGKSPFRLSGLTSLYLCSVLWFSINLLKPVFYIRNVRTILKSVGADEYTARSYEDYNVIVQMLGLCCAPIIGLVMDWQGKPIQGTSPYVLQMQNVLTAIILTTVVSIAMNVLSSLPVLGIQICAFLATLIVRVFTIATTAAFLTHVHFPPEHFGKLYGLSTFASALFGLSLYPLRYVLNNVLCSNPLFINIGFLCLSIFTLIHPVNVWRHCRMGWIRDSSASEIERRRKSSCVPLVSKIPLDHRPPLTKDANDCNSKLLPTPSPSRNHGNLSSTEIQISPTKSQDNLSISDKSLKSQTEISSCSSPDGKGVSSKTPELIVTSSDTAAPVDKNEDSDIDIVTFEPDTEL